MPAVATPKTKTLNAEIAEKQTALAEFFKAHKTTDAERPYDMTAEEVEQVRTWNVELEDLGKKAVQARELATIATKNEDLGKELAKPVGRPFTGGGTGRDQPETKGLGASICDVLYKDGAAIKSKEFELPNMGPVEFKTTMTTSAGWSTPIVRSGHVELALQRAIVVPDILPHINLSIGNAYTYMRETTFTNAAVEVAEAGTYPEAALAVTEVTENIRKIGVFLPVTDEQLSDVDGMRQYIDSRLSLMVMLRLDSQLLNGNGVAPNINGFYNQVTQTQAKGTDPTFDAILKGATLVRTVGFANPNAVVLHPIDFQDIRLTRTADGIYLMGSPDQVGMESLFGMRVVTTVGALQNTGLVGDFMGFSAMLARQGVEVQITNSHGTFFTQDIEVIKASVRAALVIYRLSAFCTVTGI